ncbi:PEGA domain-containing protein, partial [Candidatus Poribacteria bacterium]
SDTAEAIPLEDGMGTIHVTLIPAPPPGSLQVISDPPGATVRLDGVTVGGTPLAIAKVTPGTRRLRISMSGFASVTRRVEIVSNQETEVQVELGGLLHISSIPSDAQVSIDGKYVGLTPFRTGRIPAGSHQLRLTREKHKDRISAVIVEKGREKEVNIRLLPAKGSIAVSSDPPGAAVYLDGESKGNTPLFIYGVIVGQHSLRLMKPGYEDQEKQLTVEELKVSWQFGKLKTN